MSETKKINWRHKDEWITDGTGFAVSVCRNEGYPFSDRGPNVWTVYAYLYSSHPLTKTFDDTDDISQDAADKMDFHCGCTCLRRYFKPNGELASIQVGCDYNHLYDGHYTHMGSKDEAASVFADAEHLFNRLEAIAKGGQP